MINEDRLGLDVIYISGKALEGERWPTRDSELRRRASRQEGQPKAFSLRPAPSTTTPRDYAAGLHQKVILIDGRRLAELMIEHGIGVAEEHAYSVKRIDSDYFEEA